MVFFMSLPKATQDALITLYRGEASAVEAYDRALTKFTGQPEEPTLREIAAEHREALTSLDVELDLHGIKTPEGSGAWGVVANAVHTLTSLVTTRSRCRCCNAARRSGSASMSGPSPPRASRPSSPGGCARACTAAGCTGIASRACAT